MPRYSPVLARRSWDSLASFSAALDQLALEGLVLLFRQFLEGRDLLLEGAGHGGGATSRGRSRLDR